MFWYVFAFLRWQWTFPATTSYRKNLICLKCLRLPTKCAICSRSRKQMLPIMPKSQIMNADEVDANSTWEKTKHFYITSLVNIFQHKPSSLPVGFVARKLAFSCAISFARSKAAHARRSVVSCEKQKTRVQKCLDYWGEWESQEFSNKM